ncbi:MAG: zinc carboxypeptidase, partial [Bacteroidota bacterium]
MEPETKLEDSLTYDLTAWAIPYAYDLEAYASPQRINVQTKEAIDFEPSTPDQSAVYAVLANWKDANDVRFLAQLFKKGIKVRHATKSFIHDGQSFERGTLVINRADNRHIGEEYLDMVTAIAAELEVKLHFTESGYTYEGIDLGSNYVPFLQAPKVATIRGDNVGTGGFGEIWHYFEQVIDYPIHVIGSDYASRVDLSQYDVLVLASGGYNGNGLSDAIRDFARDGGKVIAFERAIRIFSSSESSLASAIKGQQKEGPPRKPSPEDQLRRYEDSERQGLSYYSAGSIYRVSVDESHPLAYGQDGETFIMKRSSSTYPYLGSGGWNVGVIKPNSLVSGYVGSQLKTNLNHSLEFGTESFGRGDVVYFVDSPIFRGFWHSGNLLLGNALFLVGQ